MLILPDPEAASVEEAAFAAALTVAGFTVALTAVAFAAVAFAAAAFAAVAFAAAAFAAVGSTIATSTIDSSSLAILGTRSFTISIHITATIPTAIILMVTDTVAFVAVAFVAVAFAVVAFVAVGDPYNQPVYQGSGGYTDSLIGRVQLRLARAGYYYGSIDSVSDSGTRAEADP